MADIYIQEKTEFFSNLQNFVSQLAEKISTNGEWNIRGFIDIFRNVYTISSDTKVVSKILELNIFPYILSFAQYIGYEVELPVYQNWYPDLTFISKTNREIKFAVDLKTTYRDDNFPGFCNGFTLGSHGEYFINRTSTKNVQYPYGAYSGHFCLGIIYTRTVIDKMTEFLVFNTNNLDYMPAVIRDFTFFVQEKWRIASDKSGSGNTANIGSIQNISDIINGNGVFAKAGEELFDDYWANYGKIEIPDINGKRKKLSSFAEYLCYRGLPESLNNPKRLKRKERFYATR